MRAKLLTLLTIVALVFSACGSDDAVPTNGELPIDENGKQTFLPTGDEELILGKDDAAVGQRGLPVSVDSEPTQVWPVYNAWEDTHTDAARKAGPAWGEDSGLTWDEKYQLWVASLEKIPSETGWGSSETFMLKTPWGKEVPSPVLECAEVAIFMRITFASWYNLPFFLEARDRDGRLYFGHFGMRRDGGKYGSMPNFKTRYPDYSDQAESVMNGGEWPSDANLRAAKIPGSYDDEQSQLGEGLHAGAYFDEVFLNKRVGYFLRLTLAWFGSVNLADASNTYNVAPEDVRPGDVLVERWQKTGIGHTLVVMRAEEMGEAEVNGEMMPQFEVEVASGSMPRRQPVWESPGASKRYFTMDETGGEGYVQYGGGLKRWRTTAAINGRWTNIVMSDYRDAWVNSTDHDALQERNVRFEDLLVELSPTQKRDVLLDIIESKRNHLRQYPASCSARIAREEAFEGLYELMAEEFGKDRAAVDAEFRTLEDYVFAELEYGQSKTCCWNRSTNAMYNIAMDYNIQLQENSGMCVAPVVFMNRDDSADGYDLFRQHAIQIGRADEWREWSEDESCPQRDVPEDTIAEADHALYCDLGLSTGPTNPGMGDTTAETLEFGSAEIPDNDEAGVTLTVDASLEGELVGVAVDVDITHTYQGDIEIVLVHPDGRSAVVRATEGGSEDDIRERFAVADFFGKAASGTYTLIVRDLASQDVGKINSATLELTAN